MKLPTLPVLLLSAATFTAVASPDPFMGEGKQGYINRCTASLQGRGLDPRFQKAFCTCVADRMKTSYPSVIASISPSDSVAEAQKKMTAAGNAVAQECIRIMEES